MIIIITIVTAEITSSDDAASCVKMVDLNSEARVSGTPSGREVETTELGTVQLSC